MTLLLLLGGLAHRSTSARAPSPEVVEALLELAGLRDAARRRQRGTARGLLVHASPDGPIFRRARTRARCSNSPRRGVPHRARRPLARCARAGDSVQRFIARAAEAQRAALARGLSCTFQGSSPRDGWS